MTIPQRDPDKYLAWEKLKYDKLFVGDDWFKNKKWRQYELKLSKKNVQVIYFEYTKTTSSTKNKQDIRQTKLVPILIFFTFS